MPYIPPHKRRSTDPNLPPSSPNVTQPPQPQPTNRRRPSQPGSRLVYAPGATSIWWPVSSSAGDDRIPSSFRLDPVPGTKELVLSGDPTTGDDERTWETIVERIQAPLLASMQKAIEDRSEVEEIKLSFLARIGKVRFKEGVCLDSIKMAAASEGDGWNKVHKSFYTHVSNTYMEDMENIIVPKIGLSFESAKEQYHVKVFDNSRPDITISCKCIVVGDPKELKLHKFEMNQARHLVADFSCLNKDLDFRLMLVNKRRLKSPTGEEKEVIGELIKSAVIDPAVKGGLRWPLGKDTVAERFSIIGAWRTDYKAFSGSELRLKLRHADRFDFTASTGEISNEVTLRLSRIVKKLREGDMEREPLMKNVQDALKLIWEHFLSYNDQST